MSADRSRSDALLGDVVAFTALPAIWVGHPPIDVARALADALHRTLVCDATAVLMRTEHGIVEARAGDAGALDAEVRSWRAMLPVPPGVLEVGIGPMGARGVVLARGERIAPERALLARLAANLADTALREAALDHQVAASRAQVMKLEKLSALGQLVSGVAHELRTPLTYADNHAYLLKRRLARLPGVPEADRMAFEAQIDEILAAHERIERIVGTLRGLSSPAPAQRDEIALTPAVEEAVRLFALTHVGPVEVSTAFHTGALVRADRVQVQQIVLNLLQNAAEAMPQGGRILVATREDAAGVALVVQDNGPGVPPEARGRIFDPFFTTKRSGTGLGLSIVRRIVEVHGASIAVEDVEGGGARFTVVFAPLSTRMLTSS